MIPNEKNIRKILTALSEAVDKEMPEWKEEKPKTEDTYSKVSDTGSHEMENAKANYSSVKDTAGAKKIETKPAFSKIKDPGANGGATGVKGDGKAKEVKLKEAVETIKEGFDLNTITISLDHLENVLRDDMSIPDELIPVILQHVQSAVPPDGIDESRNMRELTTGSPALKEEEHLEESAKKKAARLRETIEMLTGKKVSYKA